ncbi:hypothetical protein INS49_010601 [Diaporthe citri]|uniref:uncharacterized protein n=1 Tax=Diaporthe citri TaxID=83186 RepID=UPI001C806478|nr:uncharacterized protein INS49_010601 [Diaporthe citri]KAG6362371.1 hypothetical protein INS49_010601 [Diaporthe citri]
MQRLKYFQEISGDSLLQNPTTIENIFARTTLHSKRPVIASPERAVGNRYAVKVAIICALPIEADAVEALFDCRLDDSVKAPGDPNAYSVGFVGRHNAVLAHLPGMGNNSAAIAATHLRRSFPDIQLALVVGICGGMPGSDMLLGDVVLSDGIVQYDFGRQVLGHFRRKDTVVDILGRPQFEIRAILAKLKGRVGRRKLVEGLIEHLSTLGRHMDDAACYPGVEEDKPFEAAYHHKHRESSCCAVCSLRADSVCDVALNTSCQELGFDEARLVSRPRLEEARSRPEQSDGSPRVIPAIHFGLVASGNSVMKSGELRDEISRKAGTIAFEMEGAGVWDMFIIKGDCDYADSHKNKRWQKYAATAAAACMKAFLAELSTTITEFYHINYIMLGSHSEKACLSTR